MAQADRERMRTIMEHGAEACMRNARIGTKTERFGRAYRPRDRAQSLKSQRGSRAHSFSLGRTAVLNRSKFKDERTYHGNTASSYGRLGVVFARNGRGSGPSSGCTSQGSIRHRPARMPPGFASAWWAVEIPAAAVSQQPVRAGARKCRHIDARPSRPRSHRTMDAGPDALASPLRCGIPAPVPYLAR